MKITVITVCYNDLKGLKKTFRSVVNQTYKTVEYVVIDGNSNDGSKNFLEEHNGDMCFWVSEKDSGIYNAMNKGIAQ